MRLSYRIFELQKETNFFQGNAVLLQRVYFDFLVGSSREECKKLIEEYGMPYTDYVILEVYRKED